MPNNSLMNRFNSFELFYEQFEIAMASIENVEFCSGIRIEFNDFYYSNCKITVWKYIVLVSNYPLLVLFKFLI